MYISSIEEFEFKLSSWAYEYCRDVDDDPIVRQYITSHVFAFLYCEKITYREELAEIARQGGFIL